MYDLYEKIFLERVIWDNCYWNYFINIFEVLDIVDESNIGKRKFNDGFDFDCVENFIFFYLLV